MVRRGGPGFGRHSWGRTAVPLPLSQSLFPAGFQPVISRGGRGIRDGGAVNPAGAAESPAPERSERPTGEQSHVLQAHKNALSQNRAAVRVPSRMSAFECVVFWAWAQRTALGLSTLGVLGPRVTEITVKGSHTCSS